MRGPQIHHQFSKCARLFHAGALGLACVCAFHAMPIRGAVAQLPQSAVAAASTSPFLPQDPTQFAGGKAPIAVAKANATTPRLLMAIPEMGILFPVIGLVVAISVTQFLRRRRISQDRSGSSNSR